MRFKNQLDLNKQKMHLTIMIIISHMAGGVGISQFYFSRKYLSDKYEEIGNKGIMHF